MASRNHTTCAVASCKNQGKGTNFEIIYHRFPKNPALRKLWEVKCKRADKFKPENSYVCSSHFHGNDYERDLEHELLNLPPRKRLKQEAFPSLLIENSKPSICDTHPPNPEVDGCNVEKENGQLRLEKRNIKKSAVKRIREISPVKLLSDQGTMTDFAMELEGLTQHNSLLQLQLKQQRKLVARLQLQLKEARTENRKYHLQLRQHNKPLRPSNAKLPAAKRENQHDERDTNIVSVIKKLFTKKQIQYLLRKEQKNYGNSKVQKNVNWEAEDIAKALTLCAMSKKTYEYLRRTGFPFPSLATLRQWTKQFQCRPGILFDAVS